MSLYQVIVMLLLMYFGGLIFFEDGVDLVTSKLRDEDLNPTNRLKLDTLLFHTYILMNLFNAINCRVVDPNEKNVFRTILNNPLFWIITLIEVCTQCGMLFVGSWNGLGSVLLGATGLTASQQITAWCLGASTLLVNVAIKFIPLGLIDVLPLPNFEDPKFHEDNFIAKKNAELKEKISKKAGDLISVGA